MAIIGTTPSIVVLVDHNDVSIIAVVVGFVRGSDLIAFDCIIFWLFTSLNALMIIRFTLD